MRILSLLSILFLMLCLALQGSVGAQANIVLASHKAVYELIMTQNRNAANIASIYGRMDYSFADDCDGWEVQQNYRLTYQYVEGETVETASHVKTWEDKQGLLYLFSTKHYSGEMGQGSFSGSAQRQDDNTTAIIYDKTEILPDPQMGDFRTEKSSGTQTRSEKMIFPTHHTLDILQTAKDTQGHHLPFIMEHLLFDGHDALGPIHMSTVILPDRATKKSSEIAQKSNQKAIDQSLLQGRNWLMRMGFFPREGEADHDLLSMGISDYEMSLWINQSGVVRKLQIDYRDFSVEGRLIALKRIPNPRCRPQN